jgi:hypothetical protein
LTRPSTQRQRYLRVISDLGNNVIALIASFRVLVDGRVKPGHDEKPREVDERRPATANAIRATILLQKIRNQAKLAL